MLIIQFHTTKIIVIQFRTSSVRRKCLSYNFHTFLKSNRNKIKPFLRFSRTVEQTDDKKKVIKFFLKKWLTIQFSHTTQKIFQVILKICSKKLFCFFSNANRIFYANKHFPKEFFCMQDLIFCVYNVVLNTIILAFFLFTQFF